MREVSPGMCPALGLESENTKQGSRKRSRISVGDAISQQQEKAETAPPIAGARVRDIRYPTSLPGSSRTRNYTLIQREDGYRAGGEKVNRWKDPVCNNGYKKHAVQIPWRGGLQREFDGSNANTLAYPKR
eukprot:scaffold132_cov170-Amphora_coffeaeformis.AAC.2